MFKIIKKEPLNPSMTRMVIEAPFVARKAMPGQFIILRVNETGERIPLTIADYDREAGTVTIIYQKVGKSTLLLDEQEAGGYLMDFIGPLGKASELEGYKKAAVIGGGRRLRHRLSPGQGSARHGNQGGYDRRLP